MNGALTLKGRQVTLDKSWIERLCETHSSVTNSPKLLSLIYQTDLGWNKLTMVPLVKSEYLKDTILEACGYPVSEFHKVRRGGALSVALEEKKLEQYRMLSFEEWLATLRDDQLERHLLPPVAEIRRDNLVEMVRQRQKLILRYLTKNKGNVRTVAGNFHWRRSAVNTTTVLRLIRISVPKTCPSCLSKWTSCPTCRGRPLAWYTAANPDDQKVLESKVLLHIWMLKKRLARISHKTLTKNGELC